MYLIKLFTLAVIVLTIPQNAHAAKDTPKKVLKHKFYRSLSISSDEQKYPLVMRDLQMRLNAPYASKNDLNVAMFWLRDEYLYENGDPKFGLSYVQFLESLSSSTKQANPEQSKTMNLNSVVHYFVAEFFLKADVKYCQDDTAGLNSLKQLRQLRQNYLRRFSALTPADKERVYEDIFTLLEERKARLPYTEICKSSVGHMKKVYESGQFQENFSTKDGTQYIDDTLAPDLVDDQEWLRRRSVLKRELTNELLALQ
jgi:DNA-directed RNA polymerase subunit F